MRSELSRTDCSGTGNQKSRDSEMPDILLAHAYFLKYDIIERRVMKPYPPLGILYLSAYLKRAGFSVAVFDSAFRDFGDFEERVRRVPPGIVGLSPDVVTRASVVELAHM